MLAVGLRKHHQLDIAGVALERGEGLKQVINFIVAQGQSKLHIGLHQGTTPMAHDIHMLQRRGLALIKQLGGLLALEAHAFGHAVMQHQRHGL